jgi:hypothetical protein
LIARAAFREVAARGVAALFLRSRGVVTFGAGPSTSDVEDAVTARPIH